MRFFAFSSVALTLAAAALALPLTERAVTAVSSADLAGFAPFTRFAGAAYCASSKIQNWKCGALCDALPGFQPTLTGGDGNAVQLFFVGYWPAQNSVVVSHQGTDPTEFLSALTDIRILLRGMDKTIFPGVTSAEQAHDGFQAAHAKTAATILAETQRLIKEKGAKQVILTGHSLGGALAELDSLMLALKLPSDIHIKGVTYGTPRVGNPEFAAFFDKKVPDFVRINNEEDIVPIVPGRFLGFQHPHGEIHIVSPGNAVRCSGNDNASDDACTIKTVPNVLGGDILNHLGPYEGIFLGTLFC